MLTDAMFNPLDLYDAIDDAAYEGGADAVVDLMVAALTDARVTDDEEIEEYLEALGQWCRLARRPRDQLPVLRRLVELDPARVFDTEVAMAKIFAETGEPHRARSMLLRAATEQQRLPEAKRSSDFYRAAEALAVRLRMGPLAEEMSVAGRRLARIRGDTASLALYRALDEIDRRFGRKAS